MKVPYTRLLYVADATPVFKYRAAMIHPTNTVKKKKIKLSNKFCRN